MTTRYVVGSQVQYARYLELGTAFEPPRRRRGPGECQGARGCAWRDTPELRAAWFERHRDEPWYVAETVKR